MNTINNERRQIGLELHEAEHAIYLGKQAMSEELANEPVDVVALESHRAGIHGARIVRNVLRSQLEAVKLAENPWPSHAWQLAKT